MKIEPREMTVTKELYIADDGTEFEDYDDCGEYEMGLIEKNTQVF